MIHIGRAGVKLGSFSEFEVRQGLASGRFLLTDLGWKEGMENWAPLSQFSEFDRPAAADAAAPRRAGRAGAPPRRRTQPGRACRGIAGSRPVSSPHSSRRPGWSCSSPAEAFARMRTEGGIANPLFYNMIGGWFGAVASGIYLVLTARMQPPPANLTGIRALFYISPANADEGAGGF